MEILPKAFDVLLLLVERHGSLVRKGDLLEAVWPGVIVEENYLAVTVSRIRTALGDEAQSPRYVETVPRFGYRFVAEVEVIPAAATGADDASPEAAAPEPVLRPRRAVHRRRQWSRGIRWAGGLALLAAVGLGGLSAIRPPDLRPPTESALPLTGLAMSATAEAGSSDAARTAYKRGREIWWSRSGNHTKALEQFRLAVILDSTFALGWVGIADVYAFGYGTADETRAALEKAFALNPDLGEAYATLAFVRAFQLWDWQGAEEALAKALSLAPEYVPIYQWHATLLMVQRHPREAADVLRQALALSPNSASLYADLCQALYYDGAHDAALAACSRALDIHPGIGFAKTHGFWSLLLDGQAASALRWMSRHSALPGFVARQRSVDEALESNDATSFLNAYAAHLQVSDDPSALYTLAQVQAMLGDQEASLATLEQAVSIRQFLVPFANADPVFDALRETPRFRTLMARVGLAG